jgi:hypothetical protein
MTVKLNGMSIPVMTRHERTLMDLPFRYAGTLAGLMDPWFQGGMELERGRYGQPYYKQGDDGLLGNLLNNIAGGFGKGIGGGAADYVGGKLFG